ncbi:MAG TPA: acyltransferase family protein, partial [Polyangiales bacterium]|nr:acyltransferase family protein [Polyangiales bacterium]
IASVVFYHADMPWMPGGFIGVEVFLVISGFLITSLLIREYSRTRTIDIADFWARRARRLLPAMWTVIFAVTLYCAYVLPDELATLRGDAIAALGYAANWVLIFDHKSYFEQAGRPSLLKHFWSLAIEQQFYLLWPAVFSMFLMRIPRWLAVSFLVCLASASAAWMAYLFSPDVDPSRLYFGTDTRASGILLGAALALLQPMAANISPVSWWATLREAAGIVGLGGLIAACFVVDEFDPPLYLGGFFAIAVLTAAVIAASVAQDSPIVGRVLRTAPLRWLGLRSYSLYLWHFPVFMVSRPELDMSLTGFPALLLRLSIALICAELSYRFVESPVRDGALGRLWAYLTRDHGPLRWALLGAWTLSIFALCIEVGAARSPQAEPHSDDVWLAKPAGGAGTALPPEAEVAVDDVLTEPIAVKARAAPEPTKPQAKPAEPAPPPPAITTAHLSSVAPIPAPSSIAPRPSRVLAIGDSVMLGAARHMKAPGTQITVDAMVGRQASAVVDLLQQLRAEGPLPPLVVVHIGNNGTLREHQFETMMNLLADVPNVVFVNTKVPRRWQDPNNAVLNAGVRKHSRVHLVDWLSYSEGHPEWFRKDGYHLLPQGAEAYAGLLRGFYAPEKAPTL